MNKMSNKKRRRLSNNRLKAIRLSQLMVRVVKNITEACPGFVASPTYAKSYKAFSVRNEWGGDLIADIVYDGDWTVSQDGMPVFKAQSIPSLVRYFQTLHLIHRS